MPVNGKSENLSVFALRFDVCAAIEAATVQAVRRHLEFREFKAGRHGAADQRVSAQAAGCLPGARRHHQLRHLGFVDVGAQDMDVAADF